jgi:hypothetical protein
MFLREVMTIESTEAPVGVTSFFAPEPASASEGTPEVKLKTSAEPQESSAETHEGTSQVQGETSETSESSAESSEHSETDADGKPSGKGFEKRIERFNRRLAEKDAELQALRRQVSEAGLPPKIDISQMPEPTLEMFEGDQTKFKQAYSQYAQNQAKQAIRQEAVVESYKTRESIVKAEFKDYDEQMKEFAEDYKHVNDPAFVAYLVESEIGPRVYYHLATHREETDRILALPPFKRLAELGKLEDRLASKGASKVPVKTKSSAPAPISPEKGGSAPSVKDIKDPNISQSDYRALRMATRRRW